LVYSRCLVGIYEWMGGKAEDREGRKEGRKGGRVTC